MLYTIDKFSATSNFDNDKLYKFFEVRYRAALEEPFNEEQLYFYYAIKLLGFDDILIKNKSRVIKIDNQLLISYYLKDGQFEKEEIEKLKENLDERYWFQNYHLILFSEDLLADLENSVKNI
ncbi:hypothetical protein KEH51_05225 [[Brevibacterium] frigoritolerans]|uniref:Uncharacterized protein n=1 Tax=Peribacillus frigoritolerans TaxID=450367 RepID=A0A941FHB4_9BACI|nr:hypothetical protein [Peribacillus frigoritolerans]